MNKILVAGGTGYLGQYVIKELKKQGYWIRALTRDENKLDHLKEYIDDIFVGEVTQMTSLDGICDDVECIISTLGIIRQKDKCFYTEVDFQGNKNLLVQAARSKVKKFVYVSLVNAHLIRYTDLVFAKELFVDELKQSTLDFCIVRSTLFFPDMLRYIKMAHLGVAVVIGHGKYKVNPIHGEDLAVVCVDAMNGAQKEMSVGGPMMFTHKEIAQLAFGMIHKKALIIPLPVVIKNLFLLFVKIFTLRHVYGGIEYLLTVPSLTMKAKSCGQHDLGEYFEKNRNKRKSIV